MARFLFWSDLHLEHSSFEIPKPDQIDGTIDAILLAGDIGVKGQHIDFAEAVWDLWRRPVLMVQGNHEGYGAKRLQKVWELEDRRLPDLRARGADIEMLRGSSRTIKGTRVIGATLWTDMRLYPDRMIGAELAAKDQINDYRDIKFYDERRGLFRKLVPADTRQMHADDKARIYRLLSIPFEGPTVVMTHHLPVAQMLHPDRVARADVVSACYASDLAHEIARFRVDAWIAGHSHNAVEAIIPGDRCDIRFLRNIRGYPHEETGFEPLRVLDTQAPRLAMEDTFDEPRM